MYVKIFIRFNQKCTTVPISDIYDRDHKGDYVPVEPKNHTEDKKYFYKICLDKKNCQMNHKHFRTAFAHTFANDFDTADALPAKRISVRNSQLVSSTDADDLINSDDEPGADNSTDSSVDSDQEESPAVITPADDLLGQLNLQPVAKVTSVVTRVSKLNN